MRKKFLSKIIFLILLLVMVVSVAERDQNIDIPIISDPDMQLPFSAGSVIEQTWQSNIKKISQVNIPYSSDAEFEGEMIVKFITDDGATILADSRKDVVFLEGESGILTFPFQPFNVDIGVRYRIVITYTSPSNEEHIFLSANSNYGGCSIDGNDLNAAVGLTICGTKTASIPFLVIVSFPFWAISFLFMMLWKRKWEDVIGIAFIVVTLILLLAGICGILQESICIIYILSIISVIVAVWIYNRNELQIKDLLSPGLFVFAFLFIVVIINCSSLYLSRSDEFSFWGLAVKDMYYYDSLTKHVDTTVLHTYYPPFMLCIEYFFAYINKFYSDRIIYIGCQMMLISCLIVPCKALVKKPKMMIPAMVTFLIVPLLFYDDIFSTLYTDAALAVFVAYVLICYFKEEMSGFNFLRIVGGLAALTFTKPTGVVLAGLITLVMLGDVFFKQREKREYYVKKMLMPCFLTIIVCSYYLIWQTYLKIPVKADNLGLSNAEKGIDKLAVNTITSVSGMSMGNIVNFLLLRGDEYQYAVLKTFIKTILIGDSFAIGNLSFSYLEMLLLCFLVMWLFAKGLKSNKRKKILRFGILSCLAGICYCGFLLATYLFSFSEREAIYLAHHERYLASWICGVLIAFLALVIDAVVNKEFDKDISADISVFLIMLLVFVAPTEKLIDRRADTTHMDQYAYGYETTAEVARSFGNKAEQIYFVGEGMDNRHMFAYALCPMRVSFSSEVPEYSRWKEELREYQYVFLLNTDDTFKQEYKEIFKESDKIIDASFYRVITDNNDVALQYIGTTKAMQNRQE